MKKLLLIFIIAIVLNGCSNKPIHMEESVVLNLSFALDNYRLITEVKTNLPEGTSLLITLYDYEKTRTFGQATAFVTSLGGAIFETIGPEEGLGDGDYRLDIIMPIASTQSGKVQEFIGANGDFLKGDLVKDSVVGKTVQQYQKINIINSPAKSLVEQKEEEQVDITNMVNDYKRLYEQIMNFKESNSFKNYGFAIAGPHNEWLKEVQRLMDEYPGMLQLKNNLIFGDLSTLGFEYMRSEGKETDFTIDLNINIKETLSNF